MKSEEIFNIFPECLRSAIKKRGIKELTEIQRIAIPKIFEGKNTLLVAPTGSGKTEAALWPVLTNMTQFSHTEMGFKVLYITPLRALNRDLENRVTHWSDACGFSVGVRHGDTSRTERSKQTTSPPDILITTPETLLIVLTGPKISKWLESVRYVIIDEVHELLDDKRGTQLSLSLERLQRLTKNRFQRIMLSASLGNPQLAFQYFSSEGKGEVLVSHESRGMEIRVIYPEPKKEDIDTSRRFLLEPEVMARIRVLRDFIKDSTSAIVFTNTRSMAEALGYRMKKLFEEMKVHVHHSSLSKDARVESESLLRHGELSAIISTSSLELGIDVGHVDIVLQYGSPRQAMKLIQRIGRSGHGPGRLARGIIVAQDSDDYIESIVLARRALEGELEEIRPFEKSYDVLYHQTIGLLLREGSIYLEELVNLAKRTWPYRKLSLDECRELFSFMSRAWPRIIWLDPNEDMLKIFRGSHVYEYFFSNVSTIPDTASYPVIDETTGFYIGQLDEVFVLEYLAPGIKFVFRGSVWKVNRIEGGRVFVEQVFDPVGAIPSWIGEQLPVPREVAEEVGRLRREISESYVKNNLNEKLSEIASKYPSSDEEELRRAIATLVEHVERGYPVPTDEQVVIERISGSSTVVHIMGGSLVNRTLGRALSHVITSEFKVGVRVSEDPYRIVIMGVSGETVKKAFQILLDHSYEDIIVRAIENSVYFRMRLLQVAKRMGLIGETASSKVISLNKLAKAYEGTPIYKEALRETMTKDFDLLGTIDLLKKIREGHIKVTISKREGPSPISTLGLERSGLPLEIIPPPELTKKLLESFKYRILSQQITLVCSECWQWSMETNVSSIVDIGEVPRCPKCNTRRIAALSGYWASEAKQYVDESRRKGRPSVGDWELANRVYEFGVLTEKYGVRAIVAMAARGIDPIDIDKLLMVHEALTEEFLSELAKIETEAIKRKLTMKRRRRKIK